jgi:hypothetical protein
MDFLGQKEPEIPQKTYLCNLYKKGTSKYKINKPCTEQIHAANCG